MCPREEDVKRGYYRHLANACGSIDNLRFDVEYKQHILSDEQVARLQQLARTFDMFIEREENNRRLFDPDNGTDFELQHYEHFVLVRHTFKPEEIQQLVLLINALAEGKLGILDAPCDYHKQHGAIRDCKECVLASDQLHQLCAKLEARSNAYAHDLSRGGCF